MSFFGTIFCNFEKTLIKGNKHVLNGKTLTVCDAVLLTTVFEVKHFVPRSFPTCTLQFMKCSLFQKEVEQKKDGFKVSYILKSE